MSKKKVEYPPELENQFILRMHPEKAASLRKVVQTGNLNLKEKLAIEFHADGRHGTVRFEGESTPAKLVDLPCIIESHKTVDKKTFYKAADIAQMLVCTTEEQEPSPDEDEVTHKKKDKLEKKFLSIHGITPSLKNVRKRRFRKTAKKKYIESPDTEKEVKRLFRVDNEAISIRWEVLADEDSKEEIKSSTVLDIDSNTASPANLSGPQSIAEHDELREIFQDISSSENEEEDVNIMDYDENVDTSRNESITDEPMSMGTIEEDSQQSNHQELINKLEELEQEIEALQDRQRTQEEAIANVENPALKQRFQEALERIREEEMKKQAEYDQLKVKLN
ncbi:transcription initiation factor TFIID subunit 7-like [Saccoglossus kowalevskii]|uniref:Transcription initiation factor TFIID subunit 7-like n=1 Tax=Saccoglossus kowalevskii TaxID=10224 RepID=A0ABM0GKY9_SACKO|nr:PREDICTED: transcription initiation factor TFIID subunit 7-like [Saccoglossus kowalevskii]